LSEFFFSHGFVTDGDVHAGGFLKLELDGSSGIIDLGLDIVVVGDGLGEFTDSVKNGSENCGDLLDKGVGGEKNGVLLGPTLDEFLVLVEGLKEIEIDGIDLNVLFLNDLKMLGVSNEADLKFRSGDMGKSD
jgi:hypothetical protein